MKKSQNVYLLVLVFVLSIHFIVYAKSEQKTIKFDEKEKIMQVSDSDNYLCARTYIRNPGNHIVYLYDKKGTLLFKKDDFQASIIYIQVVESLNCLIIVEEGKSWFSTESPAIPEKVMAFNLNTHDLIWTAETNASYFQISPDQKKLLTTMSAFERGGPVEIIDLSDGTKKQLDANIAKFPVQWMDDNHIIMFQVGYKYQMSEEYKNYTEKENSYKQELYRIRVLYLQGKITPKKYEAQKEQINAEINKLKEERKNKIKSRGGRPLEDGYWKPERMTMAISNVNEEKIEMTKELEQIEGQSLSLMEVSPEVGNITVDNKGNIYLYAYAKIGNDSELYLLKLNREGTLQWENRLGKRNQFRLAKIKYKDHICFRKMMTSDKEAFYIDEENGKLITEKEAKEKQNVYQKMNINKGIKNDAVEFFDDIDIECSIFDTNNTIKFKYEE